jgi:phenylalanyl-tRNA synthetase beta chain
VLVGAGYSEAYTWSLTATDPYPAALRLPDPMRADQAVLRTTLLAGLVEAARVNVDAGNEPIRLFELARVYLPAGDVLPSERWHVGGIAEGGFDAARAAVQAVHDAFHLPLDVRRTSASHLHPGKAAETDAGWLGELHPTLLEGRWGVFELDVERLMEPLPERILYDDVITFPAARQDVAVTVPDEVEAGALVAAVREAGGDDLRDVHVFDVYRGTQVGEGRKSLALHLVFQAPDRTLTDDEALALRERIVARLADRFGAELRA